MAKMSLSPTDLDALIEILSADAKETGTLEQTISEIVQIFPRNQYFKVSLHLVEFLTLPQYMMPEDWQRVILYTVLHELWRNPQIFPHPNPFYPVLFTLLHNQENLSKITGKKPDYSSRFLEITVPEKIYLSKLLTDSTYKEELKQTPQQVLQKDVGNATMENTLPLITTVADQLKERTFQKFYSNAPPSSIENYTSFPANLNEDQRMVFNKLLHTDDVRNSSDPPFIPQFIRIPPPILPAKDELVWIFPTDYSDYKIMYDTNMCISSGDDAQTNRLMSKAFKETVSIPQQNYLLEQFKKDPNIICSTGLSASNLPDLVEHNPLIAIEVLLKLMSSPEITDYFSALVNMEMSLHSMEVVNRLTALVELPPEFVQLYINNCIHTCENIKDRYMQNRLVRLVCVFLQSLIRNKIISDLDLFAEIETFCVGFSRIKEAAALYKLIKNLDSAETLPPALRGLQLSSG